MSCDRKAGTFLLTIPFWDTVPPSQLMNSDLEDAAVKGDVPSDGGRSEVRRGHAHVRLADEAGAGQNVCDSAQQ